MRVSPLYKTSAFSRRLQDQDLSTVPLPSSLHDAWQLATQIPALVKEGTVSEEIGRLSISSQDIADVMKEGTPSVRKAKMACTFLMQAFVWEPVYRAGDSPRLVVPHSLCWPLVQFANLLEEVPCFTYADCIQRNWCTSDEIKLEDLAALLTFSGTSDEDKFICVHVAYEGEGDGVYSIIGPLLQAANHKNEQTFNELLEQLCGLLDRLTVVFRKVRGAVQPDVFRKEVRPFLRGWRNTIEVIYDGCDTVASQLRGETGAQSPILPIVDALLGVHSVRVDDSHRRVNESLEEYRDFRNYMPKSDRELIVQIENTTGVREFAESADLRTREQYNRALDEIKKLRRAHYETIGPYITPNKDEINPSDVSLGTGGTQYRSYLGVLLDNIDMARL